MKSVLRVAVVGAGAIAKDRHIPAYLEFSKTMPVHLAAVCDISQEAANQAAVQFGIPNVYTDYREMFDKEDLDAVSICTPNLFHADIAIEAMKKGMHVFCEKPMAVNAASSRAMYETSVQTGKILTVGFHYRHKADAKIAKQLIEAGELGEIYMMRLQSLRRRGIPSWGVFLNKELQGGGALIDFGVHMLDLALWLAGNPKVIEVSGATSQRMGTKPTLNRWGDWDHENFQVEDHATAFLRFENGGILQLEAAWTVNIADNMVKKLSLSGTEGGLDVFPLKLNKEQHGMLMNSTAEWVPNQKEDAGRLELLDFVNAVLQGGSTLVQAEQALQVDEVVEAVYRSAALQRAVKMSEL